MFTSTFAVGPRGWALDPGALRPLIDSYVADLASRGYEASTIYHLAHSARHFCYWLNHSGLAVAQTDDGVIKRFAEHRCHCPGDRASEILSTAFSGMIRKFVGFLEQSQIVHRAAPSRCDGRVQAYLDWLREHRGLAEQTIAARRKLMNQLLPLLGLDPGAYDAASVRGVILSESQRRSAVNMKNIVTVLRSYLGYLATQRQCSPLLVQAVPTVAHWRHSNVPKYLPAAKVEALIDSCDTAPNGIRDRAILLLLARLGLRAGDIMRLSINDIDWQQGSLRVCGKGRREAKLPLPQDVGDALLKYLNEARPKVPIAKIFLRSLARRLWSLPPAFPRSFAGPWFAQGFTMRPRRELICFGTRRPRLGYVPALRWWPLGLFCAIDPSIRRHSMPRSISRHSSRLPNPGPEAPHAEPGRRTLH